MDRVAEEGAQVAFTYQGERIERNVRDLAESVSSPLVTECDVRSDQEWQSGHIEGAIHVMGGFLQDRLSEVPDGDRPVAVVCGRGNRSTVAASVLERAGFRHVVNVTGGMDAWRQANLPVVTG